MIMPSEMVSVIVRIVAGNLKAVTMCRSYPASVFSRVPVAGDDIFIDGTEWRVSQVILTLGEGATAVVDHPVSMNVRDEAIAYWENLGFSQ